MNRLNRQCGPQALGQVPACRPDQSSPINHSYDAYSVDPSSSKCNLISGVIRAGSGGTHCFEVVREAERLLAGTAPHGYLAPEGMREFLEVATSLMFGGECSEEQRARVASYQTCGGAGALNTGVQFISTFSDVPAIYISEPGWPEYPLIFNRTGIPLKEYLYVRENEVDLPAIVAAIEKAEPGSIFVLQVCAHNSTGLDLTREQWDTIADVVSEKEVWAFFDCAYAGLASSIDDDFYPVREFMRRGLSFLAAQSFSKIFGLYGERVGCLHVHCPNTESAQNVRSQLKTIIIPMYLTPPTYGARLVYSILSSQSLRIAWEAELRTVREQLAAKRSQLVAELEALETPGDWGYIRQGKGFFTMLPLSVGQCRKLATDWHCYVLDNGRMAVTGVTQKNAADVAKAIHAVVTEK